VERQHGFESWIVLNLETITMFKNTVDRIRAPNFSNGFDPMSMRVAEYASSWNVQLVEEGNALTVTEMRRRFGCIFPDSVVQALVADDAGVGCKEGDSFEMRTAKNDVDMHSTHFSVSFWLLIGVFDVSSFILEASNTSGQSTRTSYAIVLPYLREPVSRTVYEPVRAQRSSKLYMITLSRSVQNVMCIHECRYTNNCIRNDQDCVQHCELVCYGTPFYGFGRIKGYPPRPGCIIRI
jgi:hypothetical protein